MKKESNDISAKEQLKNIMIDEKGNNLTNDNINEMFNDKDFNSKSLSSIDEELEIYSMSDFTNDDLDLDVFESSDIDKKKVSKNELNIFTKLFKNKKSNLEKNNLEFEDLDDSSDLNEFLDKTTIDNERVSKAHIETAHDIDSVELVGTRDVTIFSEVTERSVGCAEEDVISKFIPNIYGSENPQITVDEIVKTVSVVTINEITNDKLQNENKFKDLSGLDEDLLLDEFMMPTLNVVEEISEFEIEDKNIETLGFFKKLAISFGLAKNIVADDIEVEKEFVPNIVMPNRIFEMPEEEVIVNELSTNIYSSQSELKHANIDEIIQAVPFSRLPDIKLVSKVEEIQNLESSLDGELENINDKFNIMSMDEELVTSINEIKMSMDEESVTSINEIKMSKLVSKIAIEDIISEVPITTTTAVALSNLVIDSENLDKIKEESSRFMSKFFKPKTKDTEAFDLNPENSIDKIHEGEKIIPPSMDEISKQMYTIGDLSVEDASNYIFNQGLISKEIIASTLLAQGILTTNEIAQDLYNNHEISQLDVARSLLYSGEVSRNAIMDRLFSVVISAENSKVLRQDNSNLAINFVDKFYKSFNENPDFTNFEQELYTYHKNEIKQIVLAINQELSQVHYNLSEVESNLAQEINKSKDLNILIDNYIIEAQKLNEKNKILEVKNQALIDEINEMQDKLNTQDKINKIFEKRILEENK